MLKDLYSWNNLEEKIKFLSSCEISNFHSLMSPFNYNILFISL